ncbi:MAG: hypothetical protein ABI480_14740 [Chitinophagaceae bacterium]
MTSHHEPANSNTDEGIVADYYENYQDTQKEIMNMQLKKLRNVLFTMGLIVFLGDLLGLLMMNAVDLYTLLSIIIIPALVTGMAFLSAKQPLLSIIIATVLIVGIWVYTIVILGATAAIMGWLLKALLIYFMIAGFQNALEAMRIKKELKA